MSGCRVEESEDWLGVEGRAEEVLDFSEDLGVWGSCSNISHRLR